MRIGDKAACAFAFGLLAVQPVWAAKAPPAKTHVAAKSPSSDQLKALEKQEAASRAHAAELAAQSARIEKDLEAQRQNLTKTAAAVRTGEESLSRLESEQTSLAERFSKESAVLAGDRVQLARLTSGLVRLATIPPGGLLAWQAAPIDAARGQMLIQSALLTERDHAQKTQLELANLNDVGRQLDAKRHEAENAAGNLKTRQEELASLVQQRQSSYHQSQIDREAEDARAAKIAEQAKDLRDLMARIEAEQKAEEAANARRKAAIHTPPAAARPSMGGGGLPVAGAVKVRYGQNDGLGTTSHGITIIPRPGATVTAPAAGTVRFAGPFRGYREILILEHPGGYLSLIAGMTRIDAAVGVAVGAGEPVGVMDDKPDSKPELYYELRRSGQPVDPEAVAVPVGVKGKVR